MDLEELKRIANMAMELGQRQEPDEIEVFLTSGKEISLPVQNGQLAGTQQQIDRGIGVRLAFGKKISMGFTTELSKEAIAKIILRTSDSAKKAQPNADWPGFPTKSEIPPNQQFYYKKLAETGTEELAEISSNLMSSCKVEGIHDPIVPVWGTTSLGVGSSVLLNSHGIEAVNQSSFFLAYLGVLALREGKPGPMALDFFLARDKLLEDPSVFAGKLAKEAYDLSFAKKVELPPKIPAILHPIALDSIAQNVFLPAVRADKKQQGDSFLADRIGDKVVPEEFEIFDDGTLPQCTESDYFDAEGIAKRRTPIFQNGIFQNFLYDHSTAMKDGTSSTGNAQRNDDTGVNPGSYANSPSVGKNNWVISPGSEDLDALMADIRLGVFILFIQGAHQGSPESGDYTGVVNPGYVIRNGERAEPLVGYGIAGNTLDLFSKFDGASSQTLSVGDGLLPYVKFSEFRIVS
ncbi:MAG: TldD/PmbA family protein [Candidatus Thorarchaeota archaeon]